MDETVLRSPLPCVALRGEASLHAAIAQSVAGVGFRFRVVSQGLGSPVQPRKAAPVVAGEGCCPTGEQLRAAFKRPSVVVVLLSEEALSRKDLFKAFEFLRDLAKDAAAPKALFVTVSTGRENAPPADVAVHVKKLYKVDSTFVAWDTTQPDASATALRRHLEQASAGFYAAHVAEMRRALKPLKRSARASDAFAFVRGCFMAGLLSEMQRAPAVAARLYSKGFARLEALAAAPEHVDHMANSLAMLAYKTWTLQLAAGQAPDMKRHFVQTLGIVRRWVRSAPSLAAWAHEWAAYMHGVAANLLSGELSAFHHLLEAALCLRSARAAAAAAAAAAAQRLDARIVDLLTRAYAAARSLPVSKRARLRVGVMLAEEALRGGRHAEALRLCQRISSVSRYKDEAWWSLLGVVDAVAAACARELDQPAVAVLHALRGLSGAARAPPATRTALMETVLALRHGLPEPLEWSLAEARASDALVSVRASLGPATLPLGGQAAGTVTLCSTLPMAIAFDGLVIAMSRSNLVADAAPPLQLPLLLRPGEARSIPFVCRAPTTTLCRVTLQSVGLQLGRILLLREFGPNDPETPAFVTVDKASEEMKQAAVKPVAVAAPKTAPPTVPAPPPELRVSDAGSVDAYGRHMNAAEVGTALESLRSGGAAAVRALDLSCNNLGNEGALVVAGWLARAAGAQLASLSLWNCGLGPPGGNHVVTVLRSCPALRVLNLGLNRLGDGGIAAFARSLPIAAALEELVLWRVNMSRAGLIVLTENLLPPSRLRALDVRSNELGEGCDGVLAAFLAKNTTLQQCFVAGNAGLADAATLRALASVVAQSNFSVQAFGEGSDGGLAEVGSKALADVAARNRDVAEALRGGALSLPFRGLVAVPSMLRQLTGSAKRITHLDLSHNQIAALGPELGQLENLAHCVLSHNALSELPVELSRLRQLTVLDVSHNNISYVPTELGLLPRLARLVVAGNALQSLVPELFHGAAPVCGSLRELDLGFNHLVALPGTLVNLRLLQVLLVNNNRIAELFGGFSRLLSAALRVCNLSHNCLQTLPPPLCEHKKVINIVGNPFVQFPPEIVARGAAAVWDYLEDMLHGEQICPRMKLMFVGQGNVGKTTLLKALTGRVDARTKVMGVFGGKGVRKQTDGIEVDEWSPDDAAGDVVFSTWDFAGQEVYYNTHQFFLSQRSIYVVVFSLAVPLQETNVLVWLNSLQVRAPGVPVLLVGTHADRCRPGAAFLSDVSDKLRAAVARWQKLYRKEGRIVLAKPPGDLCFFPVASVRKTGLTELRAALLRVARAQPCLKEHVPKLYLSLLDVVRTKRAELAEQPFVDWAAVRAWGVIPDEGALRRACRLLHDWGEIVSFQDGAGAGSLSDLVILDPNWLTLFMATIVGVTEEAPATSDVVASVSSSSSSSSSSSPVVSPSSLPALWRAYPVHLHKPLTRLLERFQVWVRLSSGDYLVPCLLRSQPSVNSFDAACDGPGEHTIGRVYVIPFCPHGFFSHLLLRVWTFSLVSEYWSSGCVVRDRATAATALVEVRPRPTEANPFQGLVQIFARGDRATLAAASLMTRLVFTLHSFVQDWYGGLTDHITTLLPCVECLRRSRREGASARVSQVHMFPADAFIRDYVETENASGMVDCPVCRGHVAVCDVVPEIVGLAEGQGHYALEVTEVRSIGVGGFAEVYLGRWHGLEVAVKKLFVAGGGGGDGAFTLQTFEDFAHEVHMIRQLDHPNIVKLFAAFSRPPAIVLEYVPMGALDGVLRGLAGATDWKLVLRMALDVARGLEYLHGFTPRVVHRDLKSPNILVQSLDLSSKVLLKVADLGLSCFSTSNESGKRIENPRWVPPETLETGVYTEKSDVYSFGVVCNELVTRQLPFNEIGFDSEMEAAILRGQRPSMDPSTLPQYAKLVKECWARDPSARPTFGAVVVRLMMMLEMQPSS